MASIVQGLALSNSHNSLTARIGQNISCNSLAKIGQNEKKNESKTSSHNSLAGRNNAT